MCTIEGTIGTVAAVGTTSHTATTLFPSVPSDFTGTIEGNRHYSTGTTEGALLYRITRRITHPAMNFPGLLKGHDPACGSSGVRPGCVRTLMDQAESGRVRRCSKSHGSVRVGSGGFRNLTGRVGSEELCDP